MDRRALVAVLAVLDTLGVVLIVLAVTVAPLWLAIAGGGLIVAGSLVTGVLLAGGELRRGAADDGGDEQWEFRKERSKRFALAGPQGTYATAQQTSIWSSKWNVAVGDRLYQLTKRSWLSSDYDMHVGDAVVGSVHKKGVFSSKAQVDLPADIPPPVQVFVIAVVMPQWRRDGAAAAAAAS